MILTLQAYCLHNHDDQLKKENEKEEHEISAAVILEGFVRWTIPKMIHQ